MGYNYAREAAKATKWAAAEEKRKDRERRQREAAERRSRTSTGYTSGHTFDGKPAKVKRSGGTIHILYGGAGVADGPGHGHVKATGGSTGENIVSWRLPASEGGRTIVSNSWDEKYGNDLNDYLS